MEHYTIYEKGKKLCCVESYHYNDEEIYAIAGIDLAETEDDIKNMPENGKHLLKDLECFNETEVEIIDNTREAQEKYGYRYGISTVMLTKEHFEALLNGRQLAFNDGEYSTFLTMSLPKRK